MTWPESLTARRELSRWIRARVADTYQRLDLTPPPDRTEQTAAALRADYRLALTVQNPANIVRTIQAP